MKDEFFLPDGTPLENEEDIAVALRVVKLMQENPEPDAKAVMTPLVLMVSELSLPSARLVLSGVEKQFKISHRSDRMLLTKLKLVLNTVEMFRDETKTWREAWAMFNTCFLALIAATADGHSTDLALKASMMFITCSGHNCPDIEKTAKEFQKAFSAYLDDAEKPDNDMLDKCREIITMRERANVQVNTTNSRHVN